MCDLDAIGAPSTFSIIRSVVVLLRMCPTLMEWNEPFFRDCFDNTAKIVTWVSHNQKSFARFQMIVQQLIKEKKIRCGAAMLKSVETRFASRHGMTERVIHQKVYKTLVKDELFLEWLWKHSKPIRQEVHVVSASTSL